MNMFKKKKAQAAMEFLMTYGWAILVVLAAIGALAYFGVLSPDRFLSEKCTLPPGFACIDSKQQSPTQLLLVIQNSRGYDISGIVIQANGTSSNTSCTVTGSGADNATNSGSLTNGAKSIYYPTCVDTLTAGKLKANIYISYTNTQTGVPHSEVGEVIMRIS